MSEPFKVTPDELRAALHGGLFETDALEQLADCKRELIPVIEDLIITAMLTGFVIPPDYAFFNFFMIGLLAGYNLKEQRLACADLERLASL